MRSLEDLLPLLRSRTDDGSMKWHKDVTAFTTDFLGHEFSIWQWTDPSDETGGYTLQLTNNDDVVIDNIIAGDFAPNHEALSKLFGAARRSAYQVDEVISKLEKALKAS